MDLVNSNRVTALNVERLIKELEKRRYWFHTVKYSITADPNGTVREFRYEMYISWELKLLAFGIIVFIGGITYLNPLIINNLADFIGYAIVCLGSTTVSNILEAEE